MLWTSALSSRTVTPQNEPLLQYYFKYLFPFIVAVDRSVEVDFVADNLAIWSISYPRAWLSTVKHTMGQAMLYSQFFSYLLAVLLLIMAHVQQKHSLKSSFV